MKKVIIKTFIVELWSKIFSILSYVSLFKIIRIIFPSTRLSYSFVEIWVMINLLTSIGLLYISSTLNIRWWEIIILIYAGSRIFEIIIYQINVLLFDEYRAKKENKPYRVGSYRRLVILLISNAIEILMWFAIFYRYFDYLFISNYIQLNTFLGSIYYSIVTMSTLGYGDIIPKNHYALYIIIPQMLIGIFIAIVILARFISFLPKPGTFDEHEKNEKSD